MRIRFWGTRGSLPVALTAADVRGKLIAALRSAAGRNLDTPAKIEAYVDRELDFAVSRTFGGNTSCVEIETGSDEYLLCDMGSGMRPFGNAVIARHGPARPNLFHVLLSHVHWDHIMGFPFFVPAYIPGNRIVIYGGHGLLEQALRGQHSAPWFPVDFSQLPATIEFVRLEPGRSYPIAGHSVVAKAQRHSGDSYGFRLEKDGKSVVYSTDSEHKLEDPAEVRGFVEFFRDADLVIFDAMYSLAEAVSVKEDWGHSSNIVGVELCQMGRVKHLCLYHHEPASGDEQIARVLRETLRLEEITRGDHVLRVSAAYDGMEIEV